MCFDQVKNGGHVASVTDDQLLPLLACDSDCVANVRALDFDMVEVRPASAIYVSRLVHVRSMVFYHMRGADHVLEHSGGLPIEQLSFYSTPLSQKSLHIVVGRPTLKTLYIGHMLQPDEMAILQGLRPEVGVEAPNWSRTETPRR